MSDVSMINNLAAMSVGMGKENVGTQLGVAILKQIMDSQKMEMEALVNMIQQGPSPDAAVGQTVDVST
jgi:hypothetical protein